MRQSRAIRIGLMLGLSTAAIAVVAAWAISWRRPFGLHWPDSTPPPGGFAVGTTVSVRNGTLHLHRRVGDRIPAHQFAVAGFSTLCYPILRPCLLPSQQPRGQQILLVRVPLWMPYLAFAAYPLAALRHAMRRQRRTVAPTVCTTCGYDLTRNTSGICPECGTPAVSEVGDRVLRFGAPERFHSVSAVRKPPD